MLKWETETPTETLRSVIKTDDIILSVQGSDGRQWQHMTLTCGAHSDESRDSCCVTCPDMLIAKARAALDDFEAKLKEEPCETQ